MGRTNGAGSVPSRGVDALTPPSAGPSADDGLADGGRPPSTGAEGLVGRTGTVRERLGPEGQVMVSGELWRAVVEGEPLEPGAQVRVMAVDGLTLRVARAAQAAPAEAKGGVA